jgi:hypothetical protein
MKSANYPLAIPEDLLTEVRRTARQTGLSLADTMRQSIRLGLPKLREQLSVQAGLTPMTREECRQCWGTPDPEFDELAAYCAALPTPIAEPEE